MTSNVSGVNSHSSKPLPKAVAARGVPKSKVRPKQVNAARAKRCVTVVLLSLAWRRKRQGVALGDTIVIGYRRCPIDLV
jgi:hypothetical protein